MPRKSKKSQKRKQKSKKPSKTEITIWGVPSGGCGACDYAYREAKKLRSKDVTVKKRIIKCSPKGCDIPGKKNIQSVPYVDVKKPNQKKPTRFEGAKSEKELRKLTKKKRGM